MIKKIILSTVVLSAVSITSLQAAGDTYGEIMEDNQIVGTTITDINVNNTDLSIGIKYDLSKVNPSFKKNMSYLGIRYLKIDEFEKEKSGMAELNFSIKDFVRTIPGLKIGIGSKLVYTVYKENNVSPNKTFMAIPFGLEGEYFIPNIITNGLPVSLSVAGYYSPNPLSLFDAHAYSEIMTKINVRVLEHVDIYAGYRNIDTEYDYSNNRNIDVKYNESFFFGVSFGF